MALCKCVCVVYMCVPMHPLSLCVHMSIFVFVFICCINFTHTYSAVTLLLNGKQFLLDVSCCHRDLYFGHFLLINTLIHVQCSCTQGKLCV